MMTLPSNERAALQCGLTLGASEHGRRHIPLLRRMGLLRPPLTPEVMEHHSLNKSDEYVPGEPLRVAHWCASVVRFGVGKTLLFSIMSGDWNKVHYCLPRAAKSGPLRGYAAHGFASAGAFSGLLAGRLPGHGTIYARQELHFTAPVYLYSWSVAFVRVTQTAPERGRVVLETVMASYKTHEIQCKGFADVRNRCARFE